MSGGVALIVAGSLLSILVLVGLWPRAPRPLSLALMAACGVLVGAGALAVQDRVTGVEWALTLVALGVATPVHASLVFGRRGRAP